MKKITVLGAGYMGSAITFPLSENNYAVNLWGTWLDDEIIKTCKNNGPHPKLKKRLPPEVNLFHSNQLGDALKDADAVFIGISSEGFMSVFKKFLETAEKEYYLFCLTKGFVNDNGNISIISSKAEEMFRNYSGKSYFLWSSVGGPVKALEIIHSVPTISIYSSKDNSCKNPGDLFSTGNYRIIETTDLIGLQLCSAFKNIYATAMGIVDGIYCPEKEGMYHNLSSVVFNQSIIEISRIVESAGGRQETVSNFAGIGDLYVTAQSGRNRLFGHYIGSGMDPEEVYNKMLCEGELAEGYHTLKNAKIWLENNYMGLIERLPLFKLIYRLISKKGKPLEEFRSLLNSI